MRAPARGFTLLELLIGLALLGLIMSVLFAGLQLAGRSWDAVETTGARADQVRRIEALLRRELEALYPYRWKRSPERTLAFAGAADRLRFVSNTPPRVGAGGIQLVEVLVEKEAQGVRLVMRRKPPEPEQREFGAWEERESIVLLEGLEACGFEYFGADTATGEPTWRDKWEDAQRMPRMIRLKLRPSNAPPWPEMVVAVHVSEIAGCNQWDAVNEMCNP